MRASSARSASSSAGDSRPRSPRSPARRMTRGIAACGAGPIRIGAQAHLEKFYGDLGFTRASDVYDEDGIPHIEMLRAG